MSYLPFKVLYGVSDFLNIVIFRLVGYRNKVILQNIQNSFPTLSHKEHLIIKSKFQSHFCDLIIESVKIFSINKEEAEQRLACKNPELLIKLYRERKNIILVGGHYNNWELYAVALKNHVMQRPFGIYKPLSNAFFNSKMKQTRSKFGLRLINMKFTKKYFVRNEDLPRAIIFASDQSPSNPNSCYWTTFLNQDTGVQFGVEKYAKEFNWPVVWGTLRKTKRGHYEVEYKILSENPQELPYGKITELHTQQLEQDILEAPEYWLWSHRRWKHKKPANV